MTKVTTAARTLTVLFLVALLVLACGCVQFSHGEEDTSSEVGLPVGSEGPDFLSISPGEAYSFLEENRGNTSVVIVDVRTPAEYSGGHLDGAVNIDSASFADRMAELDTNLTYVLYCQGGVRSANVLSQMKEAGFPRVYDIEGGIAAWQAEGFPVVQG